MYVVTIYDFKGLDRSVPPTCGIYFVLRGKTLNYANYVCYSTYTLHELTHFPIPANTSTTSSLYVSQ